MSIRSFFTDLFGAGHSVNPATGLPMTGGAVDVAGNPYGTELRHHHHDAAGTSGGSVDLHHHVGGTTTNDWSSPSWPDHSSSTSPSSGGGYDPMRGW